MQCMYVCIYVFMYVCMHACMYVCLLACLFVSLFLWYVCIGGVQAVTLYLYIIHAIDLHSPVAVHCCALFVVSELAESAAFTHESCLMWWHGPTTVQQYNGVAWSAMKITDDKEKSPFESSPLKLSSMTDHFLSSSQAGDEYHLGSRVHLGIFEAGSCH